MLDRHSPGARVLNYARFDAKLEQRVVELDATTVGLVFGVVKLLH